MLKIGGQKIPFLTVVLIISESLLILMALSLASLVRTSLGLTGDTSSFSITARFLVVIFICQFALYYYDLYDLQVVSRRAVLFVRLLQALGAACLILALLYYIEPDLSPGRGVALVASPFIIAIVLSWRLLLDASASFLRRSERVLVMGVGSSGHILANEIKLRPEFNLEIVGFLDERSKGGDANQGNGHPGRVLGTFDEVETVVSQEKVDRIVISLAERRGRMPVRQLLKLKFAGIRIEDAHTVYERMTGRIMLEHLNPSWLILSDGFKKSQLILFLKRLIDIVVSVVALVITSPIMLLTSIAIYAETGAPILFRQRRIGLNGREFQMLKFRSMTTDSEHRGPSWTADGDRRITRVGRFIRRSRIDELPQLINVLIGDMSVVGPRPEQPYFCQLLEEQIPYFAQRHTVRPGITGWAQIKFQNTASIEETRTKLEYDLFYVKHMAPLLDAAIIFETWKVLLSGRGAK